MKPVPGGDFINKQWTDKYGIKCGIQPACVFCVIYIYIVLYVFQGDVQLCTQLKQCDMYISEIQQTIMYIYIYISGW